MCQCYQIGGPFIAEDPDCPVHGQAAADAKEEIEAKSEELSRSWKDAYSSYEAHEGDAPEKLEIFNQKFREFFG